MYELIDFLKITGRGYVICFHSTESPHNIKSVKLHNVINGSVFDVGVLGYPFNWNKHDGRLDLLLKGEIPEEFLKPGIKIELLKC
jgi:hypothetical protein